MHFIVYISEYTGASHIDDILDICEISQMKNPTHGITGLLFYHEGKFLQAIEGEKHELESLMTNLDRDTRHTNILRIIDTPIIHRSYHDWNMDSFELDENQSICQDLIHFFKKEYMEYLGDVVPEIFINCLRSFLKNPNSVDLTVKK